VTLRSFIDSGGVDWRVWETFPENDTSLVSAQRKSGWLTFESLGERRRLSPVPVDWTSASNERLEALCRHAEHVRTSGSHQAFGID
jgi:hypothetical protein